MNKRTSFHIRDVRDDERAAVRDITLAAYEEYATVMPLPIFQAYRRQLLMTLDDKGPVERIGAWSKDKIVGSVLLYPALANAYNEVLVSAGWPEVRLLAVLPEARGQGVGTALMDECEWRARRAGATMLGLHTMDIMQSALHLYEHRGFIHAPELDFYPTQGVLVKGYLHNLDSETSTSADRSKGAI